MQIIVNDLAHHATNTYATRSLDAIDRIVIHHSAARPTSGPYKIAQYHVGKLDWPGIGYHFVIGEHGMTWQTNWLRTISYHAGHWVTNFSGIGICLLGRFIDAEPPDDQLTATEELLTWLQGMLGPKAPIVLPHKAVPGVQTACPGNTWDQWKGAIGA